MHGANTIVVGGRAKDSLLFAGSNDTIKVGTGASDALFCSNGVDSMLSVSNGQADVVTMGFGSNNRG